MRNLLYIPTLLIFIIVFSCGQNSSEKKLIGKWYGIENNGFTRMHFYPDSLVFAEEFVESVDWNATNSKIEFSLPNNYFYLDSSKSFTLYYKFSKNEDTLFSTIKNVYGESKMKFLKAKNYIEYLNKKHQIEFSLPEDDSAELIESKPNYGLDIFIGFINNKIVGKTELSDDLSNLESDIIKFKDSIKPNERPEVDMFDKFYDYRFHLRVFADERISDSTITDLLTVTIKREILKTEKYFRAPTNDTLPIRIYRICQNKEVPNPMSIKGKKIKTIANNVYN